MIAFLVRHLIESTLFALVVAVIAFVLRKRGGAMRHTLWLAASAKFVVPAAALSILGANLGRFLPAGSVSSSLPSLFQPAIPQATFTPLPAPHSGISNALIALWLIGIVIALSLWLPKLRVSLKRPRRVEDSEQPLLLRLRERIGLRREVRFWLSDSVSEPALLGFWKPVVMLPRGLSENLSSSELESILLHELAHAKRRDNWAAAFAHIVTCIFWFYPLLWWIEKRMHSERELACDEMVIRCGSAPKDYVAGILKVCRFHLGAPVAGVSGVYDSNLKSRMEVIMSLSPNARLFRSPRVLLGSLCAIAVLIPLILGFFTASNSYAQATNAAASKTGPANQTSCTLASVQYPEGTVVQVGHGPEQMCVRVLSPVQSEDPSAPPRFSTEWVRTNEAIRERVATVVHLVAPPPPPLVSCTPAQSTQRNLCVCAGSGQFSQGALVNSALSAFQLRCERGTWVQTSTPNLVRK